MMSFAEFPAQIVRFIIVRNVILLLSWLLYCSQICFIANDNRDELVSCESLDFRIQLLQLDNRVCIGQIVDIENTVKVFEFPLLDELQHAISSAIPNSQVHQKMMINLYLLKAELVAVGAGDIFAEPFFLDMHSLTYMQLMMEDFPTSVTPTMAILTFS